jgi:3-oxoacyl-[acyl-carrier protein] reductase
MRKTMKLQLEGRAAIITGAGGGIGSAVAKTFAAEGANLCLADLKPSGEVAAAVRAQGRQTLDVPTDVTQRAQVERLVAQAVAAFGKVDILVNVAGTVSFGSAETLAEDEWDRVLAVNLKGTFLCCQAVIGGMRQQQYGRIVNIGSILGKNGGNARPWIDRGEQERSANIAYGASKAGVHNLTLYLARELAADHVTVNSVAPGPIASAMTKTFSPALRNLIPVGRLGTAQEVADACVFLASEKAAFITGEILDVNGGMWGD